MRSTGREVKKKLNFRRKSLPRRGVKQKTESEIFKAQVSSEEIMIVGHQPTLQRL